MHAHKRWVCYDCHREWVYVHGAWNERNCIGCGSEQIARVTVEGRLDYWQAETVPAAAPPEDVLERHATPLVLATGDDDAWPPVWMED